MDTIDARTLRDASAYVDECGQHADIHTVTIILNGQHGGADLIIEGHTADTSEYRRSYIIR